MSATAQKIEIPTAANENSASLSPERNGENFKFVREDWTSFRSLGTLPQKAGVPSHLLRRLVLKELVDNALDAGATVSIRQEGEVYIIDDDGPGIEGDPEDIAHLFSISRPLTSSKMWRRPTRGALGNGLRVAVGAVLASDGTLAVTTRNRHHVLTPRGEDGRTDVVTTAVDHPIGTRIEIEFGPLLPSDAYATLWARGAIRAAAGEVFAGKSSPFWYDADHFHELLLASGARPVRMLVEQLDGCSGARAGVIAADFRATPCAALDRDQAVALLGAARSHSKQVSPKRLGSIGEEVFDGAYAIERGEVEIGVRHPKAEIPYVVEVWAKIGDPKGKDVIVDLLINRTPATGDVRAYKEKSRILIYGSGLSHYFDAAPGSYTLTIHVLAPHIPITTDGKEPDLRPFLHGIYAALERAAKRARRAIPKVAKRTQKDIVIACLESAIGKASGDGEFGFNQRQLFYAVRPFILDELGVEPTYGNFSAIITDYEDENGDIEGMTRDPRGIIYHPHIGFEIPLGTKSIAGYERPEWTFNKVLFIEKEGFFETLKAVQWPERYDCALMSSKGFSSRAARDFIDMLADDDEPVQVFCVHDADAYGTMIFQTLQEETKARGRRKVEIINLGLEPWEAFEMGLAPEDRSKDAKDAPVADYIKKRNDGTDWAAWLQRHRYELNAMTMPQFVAWLDGKMAEYGVNKVVPPSDVISDYIFDECEYAMHEEIKSRILADAGLADLVAKAMSEIDLPNEEEIESRLPSYLADHPTERWSEWGKEVVRSLQIEKLEISNSDSAS